jgi:hypothetical protein
MIAPGPRAPNPHAQLCDRATSPSFGGRSWPFYGIAPPGCRCPCLVDRRTRSASSRRVSLGTAAHALDPPGVRRQPPTTAVPNWGIWAHPPVQPADKAAARNRFGSRSAAQNRSLPVIGHGALIVTASRILVVVHAGRWMWTGGRSSGRVGEMLKEPCRSVVMQLGRLMVI